MAHRLNVLFWRVVGLPQVLVCALEGRPRPEYTAGPLSTLVTEGRSHVAMCAGVLRVEKYLRKQEMILTECSWNWGE